MKTETAILKQDFTIEKGTVIPGLYADDHPIKAAHTYKAGTKITKSDLIHDVVVERQNDGNYLHSPYPRVLTQYIWQNAVLPQGCEIKIQQHGLKKFQMFEGEYGQGNYITYFLTETLDEAREQAKKYVANSNLPVGFKYSVIG